jgi:hypothetical protein
MSTADEQSRKRERDYLFQCLHRALPEDEKNILKEYAKKTLQDKPPTMGKSEVGSFSFAIEYFFCDAWLFLSVYDPCSCDCGEVPARSCSRV